MSLEKKSIHIRLEPEVHAWLQSLADAQERDMADIAAMFLTRQIAGEFHVFSKSLERLDRLGLTGIKRD